jgi:hypothetical protein
MKRAMFGCPREIVSGLVLVSSSPAPLELSSDFKVDVGPAVSRKIHAKKPQHHGTLRI